MSLLDINYRSCSSNSLVEKILERGQRLRNSMVEAVLNNDPFNQEIIQNSNSSYTVRSDNSRAQKCFYHKSDTNRNKYDNLIDEDDEIFVSETVCSVSPKNTKRVNKCLNKNSCICDICKLYESKNFSISSLEDELAPKNYLRGHLKKLPAEKSSVTKIIDVNSSKNKQIPKFKKIKNTFHGNKNLLKFVDSLKIVIYSLKLNNAGIRKVMASEINKKSTASTLNTYFVEYCLPENLTKKSIKPAAKVKTGLNVDKIVRYCSKKLDNNNIYFKQQTIHQISNNLETLDLCDIKIEFKINLRLTKQRTSVLLGKAVVNLGALITSQFLHTEQELILINENAPVTLGKLKVSLQFGCDKLYFGKEFIDAINYNDQNVIVSENDSIYKSSDSDTKLDRKNKADNKKIKSTFEVQKKQKEDFGINKQPETVPKETVFSPAGLISNQEKEEPNLMYTLIYVSEVRLLSNPVDTFLICRGFTKDDTNTSRIIFNNCNPIFNLYQIIPVLIDEEFVNRLRDNFIIVEVWEKTISGDKLFGICKLSIHQFYVAYRNPVIVKHLTRSPNPVIAVDWWEPVTSPVSSSVVGQLRAIVALGTQQQIENIEKNRTIKRVPDFLTTQNKNSDVIEVDSLPENIINNLKNKKTDTNLDEIQLNVRPAFILEKINRATSPFGDNLNISNTTTITAEKENIRTVFISEKYVQEPDVEIAPSIISNLSNISNNNNKVDVSTQSDLTNMDSNKTPAFNQRDFLNSFLEQLITTRLESSANRTENVTNVQDNSTNTTPIVSGPIEKNLQIPSEAVDTRTEKSNSQIQSETVNVRNTSDLLESLQKALTTNKNETVKNKINDYFKVHILIESALHLPSRKKCKSKKTRHKNVKNEEILPSTYVTFKGLSESDCYVSNIAPKSTSPQWDYQCDVKVPSDLLLNDQKRLIFKVWRKANGPSLVPNFQTDIVLGFAAVDLTVLLSGLPNVQGWFNIVDFSSKCNGQIKINVTPLENLSKFVEYKRTCIPEKLQTKSDHSKKTLQIAPQKLPDPLIPTTEESLPSELLSRALKRKFIELDEITQRLRQRLSAVTNDDSDVSNDDFVDEFERDLNTISVDHQDDLINFERNMVTSSVEPLNLAAPGPSNISLVTNSTQEENKNNSQFTISSTSSDSEKNLPTIQENLTKFDNHLTEGKIKIDSLLEKLSLLTGDNKDKRNKLDTSFSSRYISGCSVTTPEVEISNTTNQILKDIGVVDKGENLDPDLVFNPFLFQQMITASLDSTPRLNELKDLLKCSSSGSSNEMQSASSSCTNLSRQAPDGAGNVTNN